MKIPDLALRDGICKPCGRTPLRNSSCGLLTSPWYRDSARRENYINMGERGSRRENNFYRGLKARVRGMNREDRGATRT